MNEVRDRARLVDASAFDGRGVTVTVPRTDVEAVLASADGPPELLLDIERRDGTEVEAHQIRIEWDPQELEALLLRTSGSDVMFMLDGEELEKAIDADVEAHGLREKAAVFAVVVAAAGASAGIAQAGATPSIVTDGGGASGATPITMVSDAGSNGPVQQQAGTQLVSDAGMSGQQSGAATAAAAASAGPQLVSDAAMTGPVEHGGPQFVSDTGLSGTTSGAETAAVAASQGPQMVSDAASSGVVQTGGPQLVSDAAETGPVGMTPAEITAAASTAPEMVSDAASTGPVSQAPEASGGGFSISAPDPTTTGIIAGGVALMITAAAFTVRGRRPQTGHLA